MTLRLLRIGVLASAPFALIPAYASTCYGTPADGRLEGGATLPLAGENFRAYSSLGWMLGRAHVHEQVRAALLAAWRRLESAAPGVSFVYGETGWPKGGRFRPHRTHRNGTSVDLMVPVLRAGESTTLPTLASNRFGYDVDFDDDGRSGELRIDFEVMAEHLFQLHGAARDVGIGIQRVIFEVPLQRHLWKTSRGPWLRANLAFSTRPAWVRHDEHYHVDFAVQCRPR